MTPTVGSQRCMAYRGWLKRRKPSYKRYRSQLDRMVVVSIDALWVMQRFLHVAGREVYMSFRTVDATARSTEELTVAAAS